MVNVKFTKIFINNEFRNSISGKTFPTINPTTEEKIADIQEGDKADIDAAVEAASRAFARGSEWRRMDASARARLMNTLADLIARDMQHIAELESLDNGKPLAQAIGDVHGAIGAFKYYAGYADKIHGKTIPSGPGSVSYTKIEPVGVCGQIIPWNFPLMMLAWKFAPALATGCTLVLKPAEQTPLTALYVGSLVVEAGFPAGVINIVPGYGPTAGGALVDHPKVDKIAFTGSTEIGKLISRNAAASLKRVSLELGGKSPLVITEKCADIAAAAEMASRSCFINQGQCCCAATRTYVHESIYEQFVKHSAEIARRAVLGSPFDAATTQGPQIDLTQTEKIMELIDAGVREGARLITGGKRAAQPKKGYFVEPTVFADVTDSMRVAREEIFGPVQQIMKYGSLDEVIDRCNDTQYGLAAGIITDDINQAMQFVDSVRAGTIWVNGYLAFSCGSPFGGFKHSGHGREMGEDGLHEYCEVKTVTITLH